MNKSYPVDYILDKKIENNNVMYLIKWKGYDIGKSTWEPESNIDRILITEFEKSMIIDINNCNFSDEIKPSEDIFSRYTPKAVKHCKRINRKVHYSMRFDNDKVIDIYFPMEEIPIEYHCLIIKHLEDRAIFINESDDGDILPNLSTNYPADSC